MTGTDELIKKAGSPKAVADALTEAGRNCSRQVVEHWKRAGYVPGKWAPFVSQIYRIPLHKLNPTIYPKSAA